MLTVQGEQKAKNTLKSGGESEQNRGRKKSKSKIWLNEWMRPSKKPVIILVTIIYSSLHDLSPHG